MTPARNLSVTRRSASSAFKQASSAFAFSGWVTTSRATAVTHRATATVRLSVISSLIGMTGDLRITLLETFKHRARAQSSPVNDVFLLAVAVIEKHREHQVTSDPRWASSLLRIAKLLLQSTKLKVLSIMHLPIETDYPLLTLGRLARRDRSQAGL